MQNINSRFIYNQKSHRLLGHDYDAAGIYFVTICIKNRRCQFGQVVDDKVVLSELGQIAQNEWIKSVKIRPDMNLRSHGFIAMPDHIHGIIEIGKNIHNQQRRDAMHHVSTDKGSFFPQKNNLSAIILGYKAAVTTYARKNAIVFAWQAKFHDHIIRSDQDLHKHHEYIRNNPKNWKGSNC